MTLRAGARCSASSPTSTGTAASGWPRSARHLAADATTAVNVRGFRWEGGDQELEVPRARWHAVAAHRRTRRTLRADLDADELHFAVGDHEIDIAGMRDDARRLTLTDLAAGVGELDHA